MTALAIGLAVIVLLLGLYALLLWLVLLVELADEAATYDPFPVRQGGSCSRGGESHVRTAPAASLTKLLHDRGDSQ
jgi:hypothetical protein